MIILDKRNDIFPLLVPDIIVYNHTFSLLKRRHIYIEYCTGLFPDNYMFTLRYFANKYLVN